MNLLFLKGFNNYYNRKIKYYSNINDYYNYGENEVYGNINFNPSDGVITEQVINYWNFDWKPDYLVCFDENDQIKYRWFVIEAVRNRKGQFTLKLKRDIIADNYNKILDLPVFIEKGNVPANNPLIFNNEGLTVNQIKKKEILLQDSTARKWLVGYMDSNVEDKDEPVIADFNDDFFKTLEFFDIEIDFDKSSAVARIPISINLTQNIQIKYFTGETIQGSPVARFEQYSRAITFDENYYPSGVNYSPKRIDGYNETVYSLPRYSQNLYIDRWYTKALTRSNIFAIGIENFFNTYLKMIDKTERDNILDADGSIVYSRENEKYYTFNIVSTPVKTYTKRVNEIPQLDAVSKDITQELIRETFTDSTYNKNGEYYLTVEYYEYNIRLLETSSPIDAKLNITGGYQKLSDAPYSMFAVQFTPINLSLITKLATTLGGQNGHIYDIQILPYCPVLDMIDVETDESTGAINIVQKEGLLEKVDYWKILNGADEVVDYIYWARTSSGVINIEYNIPKLSSALEIKFDNDCRLYRLSSPNYNGVFEFSPSKNNGVQYFTVYYTYKPWTPFINVAPNFDYLYGQPFNDSRGLICNGDFSIATINEEWKNYQINNKNYENIFNTQIKTMDKNNQLDLASNITSATINSLTSAVQGAAMGSMAGPAGAIAGGVVSGVASTIGGTADIIIGQSKYQNNRQAQIDIFNYQLGNIKARPDTLTKVSAYTVANKYFPFLEIYECTEEERKAYMNKMKYEGMTIMVIGKIRDYIYQNENELNYIKAQLIMTDDLIYEDFHEIDALGVELEKGVYL